MKRYFYIFALATSVAAPAAAADLPVKYKAPPPVAIPFSWTGFYAGANGGCAWQQPTNESSPINDGDPGPDAFFRFDTERQGGCFGGLQVGYNYQFAARWVVGVEADGQWGQLTSRGSLSEIEPGSNETLANYSQSMNHYGTVRGRIGYAAQLPVFGNTLLYATGGFAWARNRMDLFALDTAIAPTPMVFRDTKTLTGYAVGAGAEFAFTPNWSVKAEYLYLDFGTNTYNAFVSDDGTPLTPVSATTRIHTGRVGLNYHFGAGPIVAKY